jgi:hypothetical protein
MRGFFTDARVAKLEHRRRLTEAVAGVSPEAPELDALAEKVAARVGPLIAPVIDGAIAAVLGEEAAAPAPDEERPRGSFDGGARQAVPEPPIGHDQWLVAAIKARAADVGRNF